MLENVEEFTTWGPLGQDGRPCPQRRGEEFGKFIRALQRQGYSVDYRELRACDYGAPTIRNHLSAAVLRRTVVSFKSGANRYYKRVA